MDLAKAAFAELKLVRQRSAPIKAVVGMACLLLGLVPPSLAPRPRAGRDTAAVAAGAADRGGRGACRTIPIVLPCIGHIGNRVFCCSDYAQLIDSGLHDPAELLVMINAHDPAHPDVATMSRSILSRVSPFFAWLQHNFKLDFTQLAAEVCFFASPTRDYFMQ